MSFDLYLLQLPVGANAQTALELFHGLEAATAAPVGKCDRHIAAKILIGAEPRYQIFKKDYEAIANFEGTNPEEARRRDDSLELNGEADGKSMAQFTIYDDRVVIHWYSGTSEREMNRYLRLLCGETGYSVVDPQSGSLIHPTGCLGE